MAKQTSIFIQFCARCDDAVTESNKGMILTQSPRVKKYDDLDYALLCDSCADSLLDWFNSATEWNNTRSEVPC